MKTATKVLALALAPAFLIGATDLPDGAELKFAAIVSRHGVRAPSWTPERLRQYSSDPWPDFGVPPSYLTPQGFQLIRLQGAWYGSWLRGLKLLTGHGCEDAARIYIHADTSQRTRRTGDAFAESLLPGCPIPVHTVESGEQDPLFDAIAGGLSTIDGTRATAAIKQQLGDASALLAGERDAFETLNRILAGSSRPALRVFSPGDSIGIVPGPKGADLAGPLNAASTLSENLLLEYANGFRGISLGWGRLDEASLMKVLALHGDYARLTRETPYIAAKRGWNLADHVLNSLRQAVSGAPVQGSLGSPAGRVLVVAGHDTNLSNLAGMLGLQWRVGGYQKNETPPGGALLVLLYRMPGGEYRVRLRFAARSVNQMAVPNASDTPAAGDVTMRGCDAEGCSWTRFEQLVGSAVAQAKQ